MIDLFHQHAESRSISICYTHWWLYFTSLYSVQCTDYACFSMRTYSTIVWRKMVGYAIKFRINCHNFHFTLKSISSLWLSAALIINGLEQKKVLSSYNAHTISACYNRKITKPKYLKCAWKNKFYLTWKLTMLMLELGGLKKHLDRSCLVERKQMTAGGVSVLLLLYPPRAPVRVNESTTTTQHNTTAERQSRERWG